MRLIIEFFAVIVACTLSMVFLEKLGVESPWTIGVSVALGLLAGRAVNPTSYTKKKDE